MQKRSETRHDMEGTFRPNRVEYIGNIDPTTSMIKMKRANLSGHAWADNCHITTEQHHRKKYKEIQKERNQMQMLGTNMSRGTKQPLK
jgi:uncharacterized membrane protein (DUF106 family)